VIRQNLATRPFYNDAAVRIWLLVAAAIVIAATVFNVQRLLHYSQSDTELATRAAQDEQRAADLRADAVRLRGSVNAAEVQAVSIDAREANDLIDRRTFSWTSLFNQLESTLPANVRITSLRKRVDRERGTILTMTLVGHSVDDVHQFIEELDKAGTFADVLPLEERLNPDSGDLEASVEMVYRPAASAAEPKQP
jgi:Tfp pilus assembly protein PilN